MTDDDDLRSRLRRADPAAEMAPLAPDRIAHLVENTMTTTPTATPSRPATTRRNTPLLTLAAAALVLIAAVGGWLLLRPQDNQPTTPVAGPATSAATASTVTDITAPGIAAKCVEPSADQLKSSADFAFAGTVTAIDAGTVTLKVTKVYHGAASDQVRVAQTGDASETMLGSGKFETGKDYLVSSSKGRMLICGYSGEAASPGLAQMYDAAF
ncbi:hypothetical protein [Actinoplanes solisilvae]|uniref:hypothetical protein n=1 Tax=Actinoplanes solisilvae TaxID=2486853 RepID=UPI000FD7EC75|nr:hypothetical protein [Actinoplanes solisilvae]